MTSLLQDLRLALRNLIRIPHFTVPTLIVLALGLGATAAVTGTLRTVFFTDPPYRASQGIHALWWTDREGRGFQMPASWPLLEELRARVKGASAIEGASTLEMNLTGDGDPELVKVALVTPGFFTQVFQARPRLGTLAWNSDQPVGAILTEGLWKTRYGADPGILARSVRINGTDHPVLGILPDGVRLFGARVFIPLVPSPQQANNRYSRFLPLFLRLAPGVSPAQLRGELDILTQAMAQEHPGQQEGNTKLMSASWVQRKREGYRSLATVLGLATSLLVLITLVNVANAMLARVVAGAQDTALRLALGADRLAASRPRMAEAFLLCLGSLALALGVAQASLALLRPMVGADLQALRPLTVDGALLGWMFLGALAVALGMGGLPGLVLSRFRLGALMSSGGKGVVRGGSRRLRMAMAIVQVSLALTLLASFASLCGVLLRLVHTPLGLRTEGVAVFTCDTSTRTKEASREADLRATALLERLQAIPGVAQAGSIAMLPVEDYGWNFSTATHERPTRENEWIEMRTASPRLFDAFGIRLLAGRAFTPADMVSEEPIAVISDAMARTLWEGRSPLDQEFQQGGRWIRVVGVVSDVRNAGPGSDAHQMTAYFPSPTGMQTTTFVVSFQNPRQLDLKAVRDAARQIAPQWPVKGLRRMEDVVAESMSDTREQAKLLGFAGLLALLLSLAGLYNLLSYLVSQRTPEFGLRTALGASPRQILALVLKSGLWMGGLGIGVGLLGAYTSGRFLAAFFSDATPSDPRSLLYASAALLLGSLVAALLPALRAARVAPAEALRTE